MIEEKTKQELLALLPVWIEQDAGLRQTLARLLREDFADRRETESRFDLLLEELRRDREEQSRKWEEQNRKWWELHEELKRDREEQKRKWEEQSQKWKEQSQKWEEQNRKWEESCREFDKVHEEIMALAKRHERSIGALGARWGLQSEKAFRDALAGVLEKSFGVEVLHINEFDDRGEVFGRPDQIKLDVVIKNGILLIMELKSSISKPDVYAFERKARFYERRHGRKADRLIIVSPMVEAKAAKTARALGIEVYGEPEEVPTTDAQAEL